MRLRRTITAVLLGVITAWCVYHWPVWPRWALWKNRLAELPDAQVLGFSNEGTVLYTLHFAESRALQSQSAMICHWNAKTGVPITSIDTEFPSSRIGVATWLCPDASAFAIYKTDFDGTAFWVHDLNTGQRRFGPVPDNRAAWFYPSRFSADGRWYWHLKDDPRSIFVLDARNGESALELAAAPGETMFSACFSPDGNALAILWVPEDSDSQRPGSISIFAIPSGSLRLRQALPDRHWSEIRAWRDDRLYVTASSFDPLAHWRDAKTSSFLVMPTELTAIHSEPHLDEWFAGNAEIRCIDGPGWLVKVGDGYIEPAERRRGESWRLWLSDYLGTDDYEREGVYVCFCNPDTGALLSEFDDVSRNFAISPDGRRIACIGEEGMIELWDSAAPRRWPWTLGLGLVVAGTMLYLNRKRSARQSLQAASSQLGTVKSPDPSAA